MGRCSEKLAFGRTGSVTTGVFELVTDLLPRGINSTSANLDLLVKVFLKLGGGDFLSAAGIASDDFFSSSDDDDDHNLPNDDVLETASSFFTSGIISSTSDTSWLSLRTDFFAGFRFLTLSSDLSSRWLFFFDFFALPLRRRRCFSSLDVDVVDLLLSSSSLSESELDVDDELLLRRLLLLLLAFFFFLFFFFSWRLRPSRRTSSSGLVSVLPVGLAPFGGSETVWMMLTSEFRRWPEMENELPTLYGEAMTRFS